MANYRGPSKNRRVSNTSLTLVEQLIQNMIDEGGYITIDDLPTNLSYFINDSGYITIAPVTSVNGLTGIVNLALFSGSYTDLTNKPTLFNGDYNSLSNKPVIPTVRRVETFSGVTDVGGNYTVTYSTAYPAIPHITPQLTSALPTQVVRITASTTLGFTVNVTNRASVNVLGLDVLLAATTVVASAPVSVSVLARS